MKQKICLIISATFMLSLLSTNCSKDEGEAIFIPDIPDNWVDIANVEHTIFFATPTPDSSNVAIFNGSDDSSGFRPTFKFTGSFTNHNIQFTYDNASGYKSNQTYSGTINDSSTEMRLSSPTLGNLIIRKP